MFPSLKTGQIYTLRVARGALFTLRLFIRFFIWLSANARPSNKPQVERLELGGSHEGEKKIVQNRRLLICNRENIFWLGLSRYLLHDQWRQLVAEKGKQKLIKVSLIFLFESKKGVKILDMIGITTINRVFA